MSKRNYTLEEHLLYADPNDPGTAGILVRACLARFSALLSAVAGSREEPQPDRLADIFRDALDRLPDFERSHAPSLSAWLYASAVRHACAGMHRSRRAQVDELLPAILSRPEHGLDLPEIAWVLNRREHELQESVLQSADRPETPLFTAAARSSGLEPAVLDILERKPRTARRSARLPFKHFRETGSLLIGLVLFAFAFAAAGPLLAENDRPGSEPGPLLRLDMAAAQTIKVPLTVPVEQEYTASALFSTDPVMPPDGAVVVFASTSNRLVENDTNQRMDIFLFDTRSGSIERISETAEGEQSNGYSYSPAVSDDGLRVVFATGATNLTPVEPDACGMDRTPSACARIVAHNRDTGSTRLVSAWGDGSPIRRHTLLPALSGDGKIAAFWMYSGGIPAGGCPEDPATAGCADLLVKNLETGAARLVPVGRRDFSHAARLSLNESGSRVAFSISAGDTFFNRLGSGNRYEAVVYDIAGDRLIPLNIAPDGSFGSGSSFLPAITRDGRTAVFVSAAGDLVAADRNGKNDVFLRDLIRAETIIVSANASGQAGSGPSGAPGIPDWTHRVHISPNGRFIAFNSAAPDLLPIDDAKWCGTGSSEGWECLGLLVYDLLTRTSSQVPVEPLESFQQPNFFLAPVISEDGRWLTMMNEVWQTGGYLCPPDGCASIWLFDRVTREIIPASRSVVETPVFADWYFRTMVRGHDRWVRDAALHPDGTFLATGAQDGEVLVHDAATFRPVYAFEAHTAAVLALDVSPDQSLLAAGTHGGRISVWSLENGELVTSLSGLSGNVQSLAFSPDGSLFAAGSEDGLWLWEVREGQFTGAVMLEISEVYALAFHPDGDFLAAASGNDVVVLRVKDGEALARLGGHSRRVLDLAFSPDGQALATAARDGRTNLWQVERVVEQLYFVPLSALKHSDWVQAVSFSPDGSLLATGSIDSLIHLWSFPDLELLRKLNRATAGQVLSLDFSPDGRSLFAGTARGVRIWTYEDPLPQSSFMSTGFSSP